MAKKNLVLGIVAHVDSGKTTLTESLLYENGQLRTRGRVDHGDSFLDQYDMEKERGITIFSSEAVLEREDTRLTLIDTPGHVDFSAEMERALYVMDAAVLLISALDGVQGHTLTAWKLLQQYQIPTVIFINKMDATTETGQALLQKLKQELSENIVDFTKQEGTQFFEQIAYSTEELLNQFLEQGRIEKEAMATVFAKRQLFPCFFGSARKAEGIREFLDFLFEFPYSVPKQEEFGARVYKITRDEQGNRLTHLKITGGLLKTKQLLQGKVMQNNPLAEKEEEKFWEEKVNEIRWYSGSQYKNVSMAEAGMLVAVTGLSYSLPLHGLGKEEERVLPKLQPVLSYGIIAEDGTDVHALFPKLKQLEEEEPELQFEWDEATRECTARFMGEVQLELVKHQVEERFGVKIGWKEGRILYQETLAESCYGIGHFEPLRHYAEVHVRLDPGELGSGIQIATECSEDVLAKNWQRLIMTHLEEKEHRGVLTGAALTDVRMTVVAGRASNKHTMGGDFRQATYRAVRQALMQSKSVLLEPFYEFELRIPSGMVGRAMTDLEWKAAKFQMKNSENGEEAVLTGLIPVSTTGDYGVRVSSYTKGKGQFHYSLKGYYPCHNAEEVITEKAYQPEADRKNPADSVFCFHGVGEIVPWNRVQEFAHIVVEPGRTSLEKEDSFAGMETVRKTGSSKETVLGVEEIDALLSQASSANRNRKEQALPGYLRRQKKEKAAEIPAREWHYQPTIKQKKYLLVDGYNVIFAWEDLKELAKANMDGARGRLMDILCDYQSISPYEVILVFDAYRIVGHKEEYVDYHNIHLVYTKEAETADHYIERFSHEHGKKYDITVVTSDGLEQIIIRGQGCYLVSSREFEKVVANAKKEFRENYLEK